MGNKGAPGQMMFFLCLGRLAKRIGKTSSGPGLSVPVRGKIFVKKHKHFPCFGDFLIGCAISLSIRCFDEE